MTKYRINKADEETECSECGYPLYVGDEAWMSKDEREVYCSTACARRAEPNEAPKVKAQPTAVRIGCFDV